MKATSAVSHQTGLHKAKIKNNICMQNDLGMLCWQSEKKNDGRFSYMLIV